MESYGIHEVLAPNQISPNPMDPYRTHEILAIKSHQAQWNIMGSMRL